MVVATGVAIAFVLWIVSFVVIAGVIIAIALLIVTTIAVAPIIATARVMNRLFVATIIAIAALTTPGIARSVGRDVQNLTRVNVIGITQTISVGDVVGIFVIHPANAIQSFAVPHAVMSTAAIRTPGRWRR
jgi:hypothetical protein